MITHHQADKNPVLFEGREVWVDALKIISCMGVVLAHSVYSYENTDNISTWFLSLCLNSLARFGVPCFMMISSVLILLKSEDIYTILRSRIPRLVITLFFWNVIYIVFRKSVYGENISILREVLTIPFEHKNGHLWYNYYLIALYLVSPLLIVFHKNSNQIQKNTIIFIFLIGKSLLDMILKISNAPINSLVTTGWNKFGIMELIFTLLAFVMFDLCRRNAIKTSWSVLGITIGFWLTILGSTLLYYQRGSPPQDFLSHMSFPCILFGCSSFALFYNLKERLLLLDKRILKLITIVSKLTMGIYFIHPIIQHLCRKVFDILFHDLMGFSNSWNILTHYPLADLVYMFCVFLVSLLICFILSKIPYLRRVIL
jgi:surface polysaccharide O-acyltransferase-like enzyme